MILRIVFVFIATFPILWAEGNEHPKVRFLAEKAPFWPGEVVMAAENETNSEQFKLPVNNLSPFLKVPKRAFQVKRVADEAVVASVQLPETGNAFIVLFLPQEDGTLAPVVIPADPSFKTGDVYFYNLSPKAILGYVGNSKFILEPAKGEIVTPSGGREEKFYDVGFAIREATGDRILSSTRWPMTDRMRQYVFFYVDPANGRITYRGVDEIVHAQAPETEP